MKFELKDFQVKATKALLDRMIKARDAYYRDGDPASCCLASPTGSGKTIMVAAAVEAFTPFGLDNLTVPIAIYLILGFV